MRGLTHPILHIRSLNNFFVLYFAQAFQPVNSVPRMMMSSALIPHCWNPLLTCDDHSTQIQFKSSDQAIAIDAFISN